MYEDLTLQTIQDEMLSVVDANMDKRPSSLIYATCAATALYFAQLYLELDYVNNQSYASTADREHLLMIAKEAAIAIKGATYTTVRARFNINLFPEETPTDGLRFTSAGYNFHSYNPSILAEDGLYYATLICETAGELPDAKFIGACTPINIDGEVVEIEGLTVCEIVEIITPGEDEEDTEAFRERYFIESRWEHYGGNIADYEVMMNRETGIGACKVIPIWDGGGTVKLVIVDPDYKPCSDEFVAQIKELVDPAETEGKGYGKAPIDHIVTVESATPTTIDIAFSLTYTDGQSWATVEDKVKAAIETYFDSVRVKWKNTNPLIIRVAYIESAILDIDGIVDITGTTLNGGDSNISVTEYCVPMVGEVSAK